MDGGTFTIRSVFERGSEFGSVSESVPICWNYELSGTGILKGSVKNLCDTGIGITV
jgi:hypothetical protein